MAAVAKPSNGKQPTWMWKLQGNILPIPLGVSGEDVLRSIIAFDKLHTLNSGVARDTLRACCNLLGWAAQQMNLTLNDLDRIANSVPLDLGPQPVVLHGIHSVFSAARSGRSDVVGGDFGRITGSRVIEAAWPVLMVARVLYETASLQQRDNMTILLLGTNYSVIPVVMDAIKSVLRFHALLTETSTTPEVAEAEAVELSRHSELVLALLTARYTLPLPTKWFKIHLLHHCGDTIRVAGSTYMGNGAVGEVHMKFIKARMHGLSGDAAGRRRTLLARLSNDAMMQSDRITEFVREQLNRKLGIRPRDADELVVGPDEEDEETEKDDGDDSDDEGGGGGAEERKDEVHDGAGEAAEAGTGAAQKRPRTPQPAEAAAVTVLAFKGKRVPIPAGISGQRTQASFVLDAVRRVAGETAKLLPQAKWGEWILTGLVFGERPGRGIAAHVRHNMRQDTAADGDTLGAGRAAQPADPQAVSNALARQPSNHHSERALICYNRRGLKVVRSRGSEFAVVALLEVNGGLKLGAIRVARERGVWKTATASSWQLQLLDSIDAVVDSTFVLRFGTNEQLVLQGRPELTGSQSPCFDVMNQVWKARQDAVRAASPEQQQEQQLERGRQALLAQQELRQELELLKSRQVQLSNHLAELQHQEHGCHLQPALWLAFYPRGRAAVKAYTDLERDLLSVAARLRGHRQELPSDLQSALDNLEVSLPSADPKVMQGDLEQLVVRLPQLGLREPPLQLTLLQLLARHWTWRGTVVAWARLLAQLPQARQP